MKLFEGFGYFEKKKKILGKMNHLYLTSGDMECPYARADSDDL